MKSCQYCHTDLWTEGVPAGRAYRCAVCGAQIDAESVDNKAFAHRGAWWSVGLGGFCIVGLLIAFFLVSNDLGWWSLGVCCVVALAGWLSVYLGVSGLLRMRYQKATRTDRVAAVAGTISGGLFGVLIAGLVSVFGIIIGLIAATTRTVEGPEACLPAYERLVQLDLPKDHTILPYRVRTSALQIGSVNLRDNEKSGKSTIWIQIQQFPKWTTANRQQFINILKSEIYDRFPSAELSMQDTEQLSWRIADNDAKVTRTGWKRTTDTDSKTEVSNILQYYSLLDIDHLTYGIVLIHVADSSALEEDEVRNLFESFRPADGQ